MSAESTRVRQAVMMVVRKPTALSEPEFQGVDDEVPEGALSFRLVEVRDGEEVVELSLVSDLSSRLAKIEDACFAVCRDNTPGAVGAEGLDPDCGRFVCMNEDGDPLIDTDDPAEVVRELDRLWASVSEKAEQAEWRVKSMKDSARAICESEGIGPYTDALYGIGMEMISRREQIARLDSQVRRAVAVVARAWCDEHGNPREDEGISCAAVHELTDILMGLDTVEPQSGVPT